MACFRSKHLYLNSTPPCLFGGTGVVLEDVVHLFQAPALCLGDKEERPDQCQQTKYRKEGIGAEAGVLD